MDLTNHTHFPALAYDMIDTYGDIFHIVVMRQTFALTASGLQLMDEQEALRTTDLFFDDDGGAPREESDLCPYKPRCDVIVDATAYAPQGKPCREFPTQLVVHRRSLEAPNTNTNTSTVLDKTLTVSGARLFRQRGRLTRLCASLLNWSMPSPLRITQWKLTRAQPFTSLPLRYTFAYGGQCRIDAQPDTAKKLTGRIGKQNCLTPAQSAAHPQQPAPLAHATCEHNPAGLGFATAWYLRGTRVKTVSAPRIEYPQRRLSARAFWRGLAGGPLPEPAGYGAIGRAWLPRRALLGNITDQSAWAEDEVPSLPPEFDHGYWNAAPRDQQCSHLRGDETITLVNLCAPDHPAAASSDHHHTVLRFDLPGDVAYLALGDIDGAIATRALLIDTVLIAPDTSRVTLVWRAAVSSNTEAVVAHLHIAASATAKASLEVMAICQDQADERGSAREPAQEFEHGA